MELQQIRYFLAIQEHGSFSRAARECAVSQPALTAAIKKLESEIGSPLFYREGKRVVATPLGRLLQPALEQALGGTRSAHAIAHNFRLLRQAPLRVGVMNTIGPVRLARFLDAYHRQHPGVELTVQDAALPALQQQLEAGELDLAVVSSPRPLDDGLRAEVLYQEPYVVVFAPGHRLGRLAEIALADLAGEPYVDRLACEFREAVMAVCGERRIELYAAFRSEREDWIESMVLAGLGFAFMPRYSVRLQGLQQRPLVDPPVARTVHVADVRGRQRSPAAKLFVDDLRAFAWTG
ncbi:LysR family transcriptional regulator [Ramlibacter sp.]|uniref:LysR family transcriptional regulator n=1 Tax=Ramlibacter sp. TaxID=1917967 RepID=UPI002C28BB92|nr:LysR substrate-binding domain-containing protein [Ramlibacter sp.]HWI84120.1 LysR substrate-binding domain-containing protein [Ramlibacter sp.]